MEGEEPAPASTPPPEASGADYAQWAAAMQAYYKASPSASMGAFYGAGVPHPYSAWGGQPMLPYGAPSPYFPGGVFPHSVGAGVGGYPGYAPPASSGAPASAEAVRPRATSGSLDVDRDAAGDKIKTEDTGTKQPEGKAGGSNGNGNGARESASGDSGSDDGTSGSKGTQVGIGGRKRSLADLADVSTPGSAGVGSAGGGAFSAAGAFAAAGAAAAAVAAAAASAPAGQAAADYWRRQAAAASVPPPEYAAVAAAAAAGVSGMDEREVKRQRRKQSNRESARRSRLRKQAECEELGTKVSDLHGDNARLRAELSQYMALVEQLQAEKKILEEQVRSSGGDPASALAQLPRPAAAFKAEEDAAAAAAAALAGKAAGGGVKEEGAAVAAAS